MSCKNIYIKIVFFPEKAGCRFQYINSTQPRNTTLPLSPREDARGSFLTKHFNEIGR